MAIAFFDFDRTLISRNSGALWIRSELRTGGLSLRQAAAAMAWIAGYSFGLARLEMALMKSIAFLAGSWEAVLRDRTHRFYEREVRSLFRRGALEALARHRDAGDSLVLLTSSSTYLSERVMEDLRLDEILCTRFEVDAQGKFTGRPLGPLCFGPGKVELASRLSSGRDVSLADCSFYSDSASDLPMFEAVGRPVAVNPDPRLKRMARRRGWAIVDWGLPDEQSALLASAQPPAAR